MRLKRYGIWLLMLVGLSGCATVPRGESCPAGLQLPTYFEEQAQRVAFELQAHAHGYQFEGILQLKKQTETSYEATLFSMMGGVQILRAHITQGQVSYPFIMKTVNRKVVRQAMSRLLLSLLATPHTQAVCKHVSTGWQVRYAELPHLRYEYLTDPLALAHVRYKKMWSSSQLSFETNTNAAYVPVQRLLYRDGSVQVVLWKMPVL